MNKAELQQRLVRVRSHIETACQNAGLPTSSVILLAVSKTHPSEMIQWASEAGQVHFGENYVQEANAKQKELMNVPIRWHFIGQLQKNKVKNVVGAFELIHSVDSFELASKISQKAQERQLQQSVLLEVNIGIEDSKGGFNKTSLIEVFSAIEDLPHLTLAGLMAMPPLFDDPEKTRPYFKEMKELFEALKERLPAERRSSWQYLSMGTTHDYEVAIQEGANIVRVGTAIFGERKKLN